MKKDYKKYSLYVDMENNTKDELITKLHDIVKDLSEGKVSGDGFKCYEEDPIYSDLDPWFSAHNLDILGCCLPAGWYDLIGGLRDFIEDYEDTILNKYWDASVEFDDIKEKHGQLVVSYHITSRREFTAAEHAKLCGPITVAIEDIIKDIKHICAICGDYSRGGHTFSEEAMLYVCPRCAKHHKINTKENK